MSVIASPPAQDSVNVVPARRVRSIDALRGITILVMIFVNDVAGVTGLPDWMKHAAADADAMTFVDVVFPSFLFIVGMSLPLAIDNRLGRGEPRMSLLRHVLIRSAGLLVLGFFMVNAESGHDESAMAISLPLWTLLFFIFAIGIWNNYATLSSKVSVPLRVLCILGLVVLAALYRGADGGTMTPQWWGILGLIGWAYLATSVIYLASRGSIRTVFVCVVLCVLVFSLTKLEFDSPVLVTTIDYLKGHATHTLIVLSGVLVTLLVFRENKFLPSRGITYSLLYGAGCLFAGFALRPLFPISKIYATPSWALMCVACCTLVFAGLFWLIETRGRTRWVSFVEPAASNPLLAYIIPSIVFALMQLTGLFWPSVLRHGWIGVVWSAVYAIAIMGVVTVLNRGGIRLRL